MKSKIILEKKVMDNLISDYLSKEYTIKQLGVKYTLSNTTITELLKDNNVYLYKGQTEIIEQKDYEYFLRCKKTNEEFRYIKNSVLIIEHLKNIYPDIKIPPYKVIKRLEYITGLPWFIEYFEIDRKVELIHTECKICNWKTYGKINENKGLSQHLRRTHNISPEEYVLQFPECRTDFKNTDLKLTREENFKDENVNYVVCEICGEKVKRITNTHLKKHNMTLSKYKKTYNVPTVSEDTKIRLKEVYDESLRYFEHPTTSKAQLEIYELLKDKYPEIKLNDRRVLDGLEIDIFVPELNIGIEYNGCFRHTEVGNNRDRNYHINKTLMANKKGVKLIHIFSDEWLYKKDIVLSKLKHIFKLNESIKIHARKCEIKYINKIQANLFLNDNHIQGEDNSNFHIGAFYKDELVALMTFDTNRGINRGSEESNNESVLNRFCVKYNYSINSISNRLIKFFIKENKPEVIVSFADRRWTLDKDNNLYTKLGFSLTKILPPNYKYYNPRVDRDERFSKYQFGKNKLKIKFPYFYDDRKSEWEIMQEAGYDRIWDCGLFKYTIRIEE